MTEEMASTGKVPSSPKNQPRTRVVRPRELGLPTVPWSGPRVQVGAEFYSLSSGPGRAPQFLLY